jgi:hypothetical protein
METRHAANAEQARYWNTDEAAHWLIDQKRYERTLAPFSDVVIEPIAEPLWMGPDVVHTVAFPKSTGIWNSPLRGADPPTVARVGEAVQATLEPYVTADGLLLGSRAWLVTASRPWQ